MSKCCCSRGSNCEQTDQIECMENAVGTHWTMAGELDGQHGCMTVPTSAWHIGHRGIVSQLIMLFVATPWTDVMHTMCHQHFPCSQVWSARLVTVWPTATAAVAHPLNHRCFPSLSAKTGICCLIQGVPWPMNSFVQLGWQSCVAVSCLNSAWLLSSVSVWVCSVLRYSVWFTKWVGHIMWVHGAYYWAWL